MDMPPSAKRETSEEPIEEMRKITLFGNFLRTSRKNQRETTSPLALRLSRNSQSLLKWENGEGFPLEEELPAIAQVYGIDDLDKLREVYEISKRARRMEIEAKRGYKPSTKPKWDDEFLGSGGNPGKRKNPRSPHL